MSMIHVVTTLKSIYAVKKNEGFTMACCTIAGDIVYRPVIIAQVMKKCVIEKFENHENQPGRLSE